MSEDAFKVALSTAGWKPRRTTTTDPERFVTAWEFFGPAPSPWGTLESGGAWSMLRDLYERGIGQAELVALEKVCEWAPSHGLATGHADTLDELLAHIGEQVEELRERIGMLTR